MYKKLKLVESAKLTEAKVTDYVSEEELAELIKNNSILNVANDFRVLDNMYIEITTDMGKSIYKVVKNDDGKLEAYWSDKDGKALGDSFVLKESAKLNEADEEELEDRIDDLEDTIETNDDLQDTVDSEENQEENPVEEESELDTKLDELREILVDLNLNLYRIASKEDTNNVIYVIGKVAEDSNETLMLIDKKPEDVNKEEIEEPIINNIDTEDEKITESVENDDLVITNGKESKILDFNSLDFGFGDGDYFYNGKMKGAQIGFYWNEEKGQRYIDNIFLNLHVGNDERDDWEYEGSLVNTNPEKELTVTLSDKDYSTFLKWFDACNSDEIYYNDDSVVKSLLESEEVIEEPSKEEVKSELESRFDFIVLPKSFDEINKLNPRYGEELTPDHEAIVEYLMNCLIETNPEAAEELQNKDLETAEEIPAEPVEDLELDIGIEGEEELEDEE